MKFLEYIENHLWATNLAESIVLIVVVILLRWGLLRLLESWNVNPPEVRLRWKVRIRNACLVLLVFGLILIWATELKTLAISLIAVMAAFVLATKELIMCFTGSILKVSSNSFSIGDRIIVGDMRGDVIDQTLLTTTLLEVGPGKEMHQQTGRSITLPNSLFVNSAVINESYRQDFVLHAFTLPVKKAPGWHQAEVSVLKIANEVCAPYIEDAKKHFKKLAAKKEFDPPSIEPRVSITIPEPERVNLIVRIPAPFRRKGRIEQEIIHRYLQEEAEGPNTKAAN